MLFHQHFAKALATTTSSSSPTPLVSRINACWWQLACIGSHCEILRISKLEQARESPRIFGEKKADSSSGSVIQRISGALQEAGFEWEPQVILIRHSASPATCMSFPLAMVLQLHGPELCAAPWPWASSQDIIPSGLGLWLHSAPPSIKAPALSLNLTLDIQPCGSASLPWPPNNYNISCTCLFQLWAAPSVQLGPFSHYGLWFARVWGSWVVPAFWMPAPPQRHSLVQLLSGKPISIIISSSGWTLVNSEKLESWKVCFLFQAPGSLMSTKFPTWYIPESGASLVGLELWGKYIC